MNLVKLIRNLRNQIILSNLNGYSDYMKFKVKNNMKNVIIIDKPDEEIKYEN